MASSLLAALHSCKSKIVNDGHLPPLLDAASAGLTAEVEKFLEDPKQKIDMRDSLGLTALMHAAKNEEEEMVDLLIGRGARVPAKDDMGENSLMKACRTGNTSIILKVIEAHCATLRKPALLAPSSEEAIKKKVLEAKDDEGVTGIMKAAESGRLEVIELLVEQGANVQARDDHDWNAMMWAALAGRLEVMEWLAENVAEPIDFQNAAGETPLIKAAASGHWDVCEWLLSKGAKVNAMDLEGQTALHWAAAGGHNDVVMVRRCEKPYVGHFELIRTLEDCDGLIDHDAKVDLETKSGKTAIMLAALFAKLAVCQYLVGMGAKPETKDMFGYTPLAFAVKANHPALCELLLDAKCNLQTQSKRGETLLMVAAQSQSLDCAKLLIHRGADISKVDENGQSALDIAEGTLNSRMVDIFRVAARMEEQRQKLVEEEEEG